MAVQNWAEGAAAEALVKAGLAQRLQHVEVTHPLHPIAQNGLSGFSGGGVALKDGSPVEWFAVGLGRDGRGLLAVGAAALGQFETWRPVLLPVLQTLGPLGGAGPAGVRWESYPAANVRFMVPARWATARQGDMLVTRPPGTGLFVDFIAVRSLAEGAAAEQALRRTLEALFQDVQVKQPLHPVTQNGLEGFELGGVATKEGKPLEWYAVGLARGGQGVLAVGVAGAGQFARHRPELLPVFQSIGPLR
jgi:hypothetical protein